MSDLIAGIHHITAITSDAQGCVDFYSEVLGLRLVKVTVNFDDPGTYHLYFGDSAGQPGTILTFFPFEHARRGTVGNGDVSAIAFAVPPGSLDFWRDRLGAARVPMMEGPTRFGDAVLRLADPDGLPLELVEARGWSAASAWSGSDVPLGQAVAGFHSATLAEEGYERTAALLTEVMHLRSVGQEADRFRFAADGTSPGTIVDVVRSPNGRPGRLGSGTVHHIAWRTPDDDAQARWRGALADRGYNVTPVMDRVYFHSIYFREPGGILFEIATDPPGFLHDEPQETLGSRLMLPPWLEPIREGIAGALPPLRTAPGPTA